MPQELLDPELDVQRDFSVDIATGDVPATEHQVEEAANARSDVRHQRARAGAERMPLTVSA